MSETYACVFITASELAELIFDEPAGLGSAGSSGVAATQPLIADDTQLRVLDVRWQLGRSDGRAQYMEAHIPGAVYVDLETELAVAHGDGHAGVLVSEGGRHPLPACEDFTRAVRSWGISDSSTVVVYDAVSGTSAARVWWMLRNAGLADVRILDGGLPAWTAAGYAVEAGDVQIAASDIVLGEGHMPTITIDQAAAWPGEGILIDARAAERYRGEVEPVDPRAGHIPGAISVPTFSHLGEAGMLRSTTELIEAFEEAGVIDPQVQDGCGGAVSIDVPVAVYCGSGVTASHEIAVLASLGIEASLFPGSWSQWSNNPERPVATGTDEFDEDYTG
jgi:thiosulfate/3-mercaptopyruvate sulfurtransferase